MRTYLYKANIFAASAYAVVSIFVCSNYDLWLPHPVGHLFPVASAVVAVIWSFHCWLLGMACNFSSKSAFRTAMLPFVLALVAGIACWIHYRHEITQSYKALEWFRRAAYLRHGKIDRVFASLIVQAPPKSNS